MESFAKTMSNKFEGLEIYFQRYDSYLTANTYLSGLGWDFSKKGLRKEAIWIRIPRVHRAPWENLMDVKAYEVVNFGGLHIWYVKYKKEYLALFDQGSDDVSS